MCLVERQGEEICFTIASPLQLGMFQLQQKVGLSRADVPSSHTGGRWPNTTQIENIAQAVSHSFVTLSAMVWEEISSYSFSCNVHPQSYFQMKPHTYIFDTPNLILHYEGHPMLQTQIYISHIRSQCSLFNYSDLLGWKTLNHKAQVKSHPI